MSIYRAKKISLRGGQLKIMANPDTWGNKLSPLEIFETKLLPQHPPVLKEWFVHQFPDPTAWYLARTSFSRSNAVMSMVG
jgi:phosphatidylinositol kinase/protein kinase (PI-3  family)